MLKFIKKYIMHIMFLSDNFPPEVNACASRVFERACYWVRWGHQVTVITCAPNFPEGKVYPGYQNKWYQVEFMEGIRIIRVKTFIVANRGLALRIIDFMSYMLMAIIAGVWQKKPDIIVATSPQFFAAVGGWILSRFKRTPFILEISDLWPESIIAVGAMKPSLLLRWLERLELFLYHQAKYVIVLTHAFKKNLVTRKIPAHKIQVIMNGVDLNRYRLMAKDPNLLQRYSLQQKFIVGYIGTLGMAQDLIQILHAAKACQNQAHITFLFVGSGADTKLLQEQIQAWQLSNVILIPRQPKPEITRYWSLCDIGLVHLKNEATFSSVLPSKLFEMMGMGLPICCVAPPGEATTLIEQTQSGITLPAGNPQLLADTLIRVSIQPEQLAQWSANSYRARQQFTREYQAQAMLQVFQDTMSSAS